MSSAIPTPQSPRAALVVALLPWVLTACYVEEAHDLPSDVVWRSGHFAYHTRTGEQFACEGLMATLEQHLSSIQASLGLDWPAGRTIDYYKFTTQEDFATHSPCPVGSAACTDRTRVYAYQPFEQHELVHAYFWHLGLPPPVIVEGTAVALVCKQAIPERPSLSLADAMRVRDALADQRVYDTGARLVRYLLDGYGAEPFLRFYPQLGLTASLGDLDRVLRSVYGLGAEEIWAATLAAPAHCPPVFACSRDSLPLDGTSTEIVPVCGLYTDARSVALGADGEIAISGPASLSVGSCDAGAFSTLRLSGADIAGRQLCLVPLPQGRYYLEVRATEATTLQALSAETAWAGVDCSALQPLRVPDAQPPDVRVVVPPETPEWVVKLRFETARELSVRWPAATELSICSDCSQEHCQALQSSWRRWDVTWQGDYVLRVHGAGQSETSTLDIVGR